MILGIGTDIVDIRRIEAALKRSGARFEARIFTQKERALAQKRTPKARASFYAKRFAAKEAFAKAAGCGIGKSLAFKDMEILSARSGAPSFHCLAGARKVLKQLGSKSPTVSVSLSDEYPYAQAFVVISGEGRS